MTQALTIKRVVVTGGRNFRDVVRMHADLYPLFSADLHRLAQGGAQGADSVAAWTWHLLTGCRPTDAPSPESRSVVYPADWCAHGKAAGPRRNIEMLAAEQPDLVLAYPDPTSVGTWHCVREALKRDVPVVVWAPFLASDRPALRAVTSLRAAVPDTNAVWRNPRWVAGSAQQVADLLALFGGDHA